MEESTMRILSINILSMELNRFTYVTVNNSGQCAKTAYYDKVKKGNIMYITIDFPQYK